MKNGGGPRNLSKAYCSLSTSASPGSLSRGRGQGPMGRTMLSSHELPVRWLAPTCSGVGVGWGRNLSPVEGEEADARCGDQSEGRTGHQLCICSSIRDADQQVLYTRGSQLLLGDPDAGNCCAGEPWAFPTTGSPPLLSWDGEKGQLRVLLMRGSRCL